MDQLRKKISDCAADPAVEFGRYSITDIGIITCILFDSFSMHNNRMDVDDFNSDFDQCVDKLQRTSM